MQDESIAPSKTCRRCGQLKVLAEFNRSRNRGGETLHSYCRECQRSYNRCWATGEIGAAKEVKASRAAAALAMGLRMCPACGELKPLTAFGRRLPDGLRRNCKNCHSREVRTSRQANPERSRQSKRAERLRHRDRYLRYAKEYRTKFAEKVRAGKAASVGKRRDHYIQQAMRWARANPDRRAAIVSRRRSLSSGGTFTAQEWRDLKERYGNRCLACGRAAALTVDHVIPLTRGGRGSIDNVQPLCRPCNSRKGQRSIDYRQSVSVS